MAVSKETKYLQEFKATRQNCKFRGIVQNKLTNALSLYFMIRMDYTWQDVNLLIPVSALSKADELNDKLAPLVSAWKSQGHFDYITSGVYYGYPVIDKDDKARLRQLLVTKFEYVISLIADLDAILDLNDNRNVRPKIREELNGLITMGPFQITDFSAFTQSWSYNYLKSLNNFDSEPFTITTNFFGQDRASSRLLVTKDNGDTFMIKAGDFESSWKYVEHVPEKEMAVDETETNSMAFDL